MTTKGVLLPARLRKKISEELKLKQAELQCCRILSDYNHLLEKWKTVYVPDTPEEEWHPLFVEALQKQTYTEYLLDTLLGGTAEEKAGIIKEHGKEVMRIGERISGLAACRKAGRDERSGYACPGNDSR